MAGKTACPYCGVEYAVAGMTSHVRHKHPEKYEEFKAKKGAKKTPVATPTPPQETPL